MPEAQVLSAERHLQLWTAEAAEARLWSPAEARKQSGLRHAAERPAPWSPVSKLPQSRRNECRNARLAPARLRTWRILTLPALMLQRGAESSSLPVSERLEAHKPEERRERLPAGEGYGHRAVELRRSSLMAQ